MTFQGLIFDCDGTLVDSMPPHYEAWKSVSQKYSLNFTEQEFYDWGGWPTIKVARHLIERAGLSLDPHAIGEEKEQGFVDRLETVVPIPEVVSVVKQWHGKVPMAVATGGTEEICHPMLKTHGLFDYFETIVTVEQVEHPKLAPDTYLEAAKRIGIAPEQCCAYEDTDPGVESARSAGMTVVDVRTLRC